MPNGKTCDARTAWLAAALGVVLGSGTAGASELHLSLTAVGVEGAQDAYALFEPAWPTVRSLRTCTASLPPGTPQPVEVDFWFVVAGDGGVHEVRLDEGATNLGDEAARDCMVGLVEGMTLHATGAEAPVAGRLLMRFTETRSPMPAVATLDARPPQPPPPAPPRPEVAPDEAASDDPREAARQRLREFVAQQPSGSPTGVESISGDAALVDRGPGEADPGAAPPGEVVLGEAQFEGGDADEATREFRRRRGQLQYCWQQTLRQEPVLQGGHMSIQIEVKAQGGVQDVQLLESTVESDALWSCIERSLQRWRFPRREDDGLMRATLPVTFSR